MYGFANAEVATVPQQIALYIDIDQPHSVEAFHHWWLISSPVRFQITWPVS